MNRSALCIKMLQILNAHDFVTTKELAFRLETNPRNILEFKKELEVAGYMIESVKGRYGGYRLVDKAMLPPIRLSESEKKSMNEAYSYLKNHSDFLFMDDYTTSYEKIKSSLTFQDEKPNTIYKQATHRLKPSVEKMIHLCEKAIESCQTIHFEYRSMKSVDFLEVECCPYEILNIRGEYYCLGYNRAKQGFRIYKFSELRMRDLTMTHRKFTRDLDFNVNAYLGEKGLMKDEVIEVEFIILKDKAMLYADREIGVHPVAYFDSKQNFHVKTSFEGKMSAIQFLCSLGASCEVVSPIEIREEIKQEVLKMAENYL